MQGTCSVCTHEHTNADGTCASCECEEMVGAEGETPMADMPSGDSM